MRANHTPLWARLWGLARAPGAGRWLALLCLLYLCIDIKCEKKFLLLKNFLFGNVVLVESRNTAIQLSKSGFKTITISGEYFEAKTTSVTIDNNSKISKLTKIINMSDSVEGLQQMIAALRQTVTKKKNRAKKLDLLIKNYAL